MQKIGKQITITKLGQEQQIEIVPFAEKKDKTSLLMWLLAWSFCGVAVFSQLFFTYSSNEKVAMAIYLVFWLYFELKVLHAFRWQQAGKEVIEIKEGKLIYTRLIGKRGLPIEYKLSEIKAFKLVENKKKGFLNEINQSIWMVGGETIEFNTHSQSKSFALKLSDQDAKNLLKHLNQLL